MRFPGWLVAVFLVGTLSSCVAYAQALPPPDVDKVLASRLNPRTDLAIVVGLVGPDFRRVIASGKAGPNGSPALDGDTVFEIGSVTKVFTASILADMVVKKEVALEDPVQKYLPDSVRMPTRGGKDITLRDLATQSSGLPRMPTNFAPKDLSNPYADYSVQLMYEFLSGYQLTHDIDAQYEYSNLGVGLLGHALARRAGTSYEQLVVQRILDPLGMKDTRVTLTSSMKPRLAVGHSVVGLPTPNWDLPTFAGAGALRSTVNDMLKFAEANLNTVGPLAAAFKEAHSERRPAGSDRMGIGLVWHIRKGPNRTIVWHNGGTGGYHSFLGFDRAAGKAVVVLHNGAGSIDDIGFHLLDSRSPLADPATLPKARAAIAMAPAELDTYVGQYDIVPGVSAFMTRDGSRLLFNLTGQAKSEILPESDTAFFLGVIDVQVTFIKDTSGAVTALVIHQNGRDTRASRAHK